METMKINILGAGKMGAGMAFVASHYKGFSVKLWNRTPAVVEAIQKERESTHLPGIKLPEGVSAVFNLEEALGDGDLLVLAVPSFAIREMCQRLVSFKDSLPPLLMISKGLEKETGKLPFQIVEEVLDKKDILHISGIGYPPELPKERQVVEVTAALSNDLLEKFDKVFETSFIKFERSNDLLGAELAGAMKNILVIVIGLVSAKEENESAKQQLIEDFIPLGLQEMVKLGRVFGAQEETFYGPAGEGDFRFSAEPMSRNFRLGQDLFEKGLEEVQEELRKTKRTVEGVLSAYAAHQLAQKYGLNLPMVEAVYKVIYQGGSPKQVAEELLRLVVRT